MKLWHGLIDIKIKWQKKDMNLLSFLHLVKTNKYRKVNNFDTKLKEGKNEKDYLDKANNEIAEYFKKEITNLLGKVL